MGDSRGSISELYEGYYEEYRQKYGPKTIVLIELGGFLEICALERNAPQLAVCHELCVSPYTLRSKAVA